MPVPVPVGRREVDAAPAEGEVGEASSAKVLATSLRMETRGSEVTMVPLAVEGEVGGVEEEGQTRRILVPPSDRSNSIHQTSSRCTHNARRLDTRYMRQDAAVPR